MELIFRKGIAGDLPQLKELKRVSYGQYRAVFTPEHWSTWQANLNNGQALVDLFAQATTFICADGEHIVGMAFLIPSGNPTDIVEAGWSNIRLVGVDPNYGGRGIAKKLTGMCLEHARLLGEKVVSLHTSEFMDAARHIYEGLGFKKLKEIPPRFGKKYWVYTLDLNQEHINIAPFQVSHQPGVDDMLSSIAEEYAEGILSPVYKKIAELYMLPGRYYWTAMDGDKVVGTVGLICADGHAVLKAMFLHRDYRGGNNRVAWRLLEKAIEKAKQASVQNMYLGTMAQFKAAQRFYEKNGFGRIEESALPEGFPGNNMDTVFYQLKLS